MSDGKLSPRPELLRSIAETACKLAEFIREQRLLEGDRSGSLLQLPALIELHYHMAQVQFALHSVSEMFNSNYWLGWPFAAHDNVLTIAERVSRIAATFSNTIEEWNSGNCDPKASLARVTADDLDYLEWASRGLLKCVNSLLPIGPVDFDNAGAEGKSPKVVAGDDSHEPHRWLRVTEAETVSGISKGEISRACDAGQLKSNGKSRHDRRVDSLDLTRWKLAKESAAKVKAVTQTDVEQEARKALNKKLKNTRKQKPLH